MALLVHAAIVLVTSTGGVVTLIAQRGLPRRPDPATATTADGIDEPPA